MVLKELPSAINVMFDRDFAVASLISIKNKIRYVRAFDLFKRNSLGPEICAKTENALFICRD